MSTIFTRHATALCTRAPNAVAVVYGAEKARGPLDLRDVEGIDASGAPSLYRAAVLTLPSDAFVAVVTRHTRIRVAGDWYSIRDFRRIEDGLLTEYFLAEVPA